MNTLIHRINCRGCLSLNIVKFLDLGKMPLAGGFLDKNQIPDEKRFDLSVYFCRNCSLVQIIDVVPPNILFEKYQYISSVIKSLSDYFKEYAAFLQTKQYLPSEGFLVEFGCNDGVLLECLSDSNIGILGVDPSKNVSEMGRQKGLPIITDYFTVPVAEMIKKKNGKADVVTGSNVFAHTDDIHEIVKAAKTLLKNDGVFIVEVHYIVDLLNDCQYDTIYHEHLLYYSVHALNYIMTHHNLKLINVVRTKMHGGAIRVIAARQNSKWRPESSVEEILSLEKEKQITSEKTYINFGEHARAHAEKLKSLLLSLKKKGNTISGYGAPGRGTILLNYAKIGNDILGYIIDASPLRAHKYMPGVHTPIHSHDYFKKNPTDYSLMLAWNYKDYIFSQEKEYIANGGKFIIPFPYISIHP